MRRCAKIITDSSGKEKVVRCCCFCSMPNRLGESIYVICNLNGYGSGMPIKNKFDCSDFRAIKEKNILE
jgi:hypothetical protein